jgi:hypothetical protein
MRVSELTAISGLPEAETLHAVYTLALGGFLQRERWACAFAGEVLKMALAIKDGQARAAATKGASKDALKEEKSGAGQTKPVVGQKTEQDERRELEALFERLKEATNYYQVLGVGRAADAAFTRTGFTRTRASGPELKTPSRKSHRLTRRSKRDAAAPLMITSSTGARDERVRARLAPVNLSSSVMRERVRVSIREDGNDKRWRPLILISGKRPG